MAIRVLCFILMVVITPYGWYTWLFGAAAIFLPYIAVVFATVGQEARRNRREDPERSLPAAPTTVFVPHSGDVIRVDETPMIDGKRTDVAAGDPPDERPTDGAA